MVKRLAAFIAVRLMCLLMVAIVAVPLARAQTGVYTLNGGTASQTNQTYAATLTDQSSVYVLNSGHLTLTTCTMTKTGDSSNNNNSSRRARDLPCVSCSAIHSMPVIAQKPATVATSA